MFALSPPFQWDPCQHEPPSLNRASNPQSSHAHWMSFDLSDLPELIRTPDPELVDLIERAFLEGQIDGSEADLSYLWLITSQESCANIV